jgi:hypothetical protein
MRVACTARRRTNTDKIHHFALCDTRLNRTISKFFWEFCDPIWHPIAKLSSLDAGTIGRFEWRRTKEGRNP